MAKNVTTANTSRTDVDAPFASSLYQCKRGLNIQAPRCRDKLPKCGSVWQAGGLRVLTRERRARGKEGTRGSASRHRGTRQRVVVAVSSAGEGSQARGRDSWGGEKYAG